MLEIRRVLCADGEPVILETLFFTMACSWLENAGLEGSLYRLLQEYGIRAEKCTYDLALTGADQETARILQTEEKSPLLSVRQLVYDQRGRPLHTGFQLVRGDRFTLRI